MALLEDEDDDAVRAAERDQVQDHCLGRQHDRAERAREKDEREHDHEQQHPAEVPVDRVDEVALLRELRRRASTSTPGPAAAAAAGSTVSWRLEITFRLAFDDASVVENASMSASLPRPPPVAGGRRDALDTVGRAHGSSDRVELRRVGRALDEHGERLEDTLRDPRGGQRLPPGGGVGRRRLPRGLGVARVDLERRDQE